jgi:hypothetical protein
MPQMTRKVPSWHKTCQDQNKFVAGADKSGLSFITSWFGVVKEGLLEGGFLMRSLRKWTLIATSMRKM